MGAGQPFGTVRRPPFHSLRAGTLRRAWRLRRVSCAVLVAIRDRSESRSERWKPCAVKTRWQSTRMPYPEWRVASDVGEIPIASQHHKVVTDADLGQ